MLLSVRTMLLLVFVLAIGGGTNAGAAKSAQQGSCSTDELVEIYPGYSGFNG